MPARTRLTRPLTFASHRYGRPVADRADFLGATHDYIAKPRERIEYERHPGLEVDDEDGAQLVGVVVDRVCVGIIEEQGLALTPRIRHVLDLDPTPAPIAGNDQCTRTTPVAQRGAGGSCCADRGSRRRRPRRSACNGPSFVGTS